MGREGFTFVEMMITGVIMSLIGGAVLVMAQSSNQVWNRTDVRLASISNAQQAMNRLVGDLHRASQQDVVCTPGDAVDQTDDTLSFYDAPRTDNDQIIYSLNAGQLIRRQNATDVPVASNLTAFVPTCQGGGVVRLQVTVQVATTLGGTRTQSLDSRAWIQNP